MTGNLLEGNLPLDSFLNAWDDGVVFGSNLNQVLFWRHPMHTDVALPAPYPGRSAARAAETARLEVATRHLEFIPAAAGSLILDAADGDPEVPTVTDPRWWWRHLTRTAIKRRPGTARLNGQPIGGATLLLPRAHRSEARPAIIIELPGRALLEALADDAPFDIEATGTGFQARAAMDAPNETIQAWAAEVLRIFIEDDIHQRGGAA